MTLARDKVWTLALCLALWGVKWRLLATWRGDARHSASDPSVLPSYAPGSHTPTAGAEFLEESLPGGSQCEASRVLPPCWGTRACSRSDSWAPPGASLRVSLGPFVSLLFWF